MIYLVEGSEGFSELIGTAMRTAKPSVYAVSDLVRLECLVGPLRTGNQGLVEAYRRQFNTLHILEMSHDVFDRAADIRARSGFKTPDALHLATALHYRCGEFWTGDGRLAAMQDQTRIRVFTE